MASSDLENLLYFQIRAEKLPEPVREYKFHVKRRWRFDLAWPDRLIAAEVEGGTWSGGRHTRGKGFQNDCTKYNAAALDLWRVFRFTNTMIKKGEAIDTLIQALR